ncbi:MAG: basic amino acid ABC transporter substrate-binding protein [Succinivibrio sp.]
MNIFQKLMGIAVVAAASQGAFASDKVLKVATEPSFAPFEFMDQTSSELIGFDIDIIKAIAEVEGYETDISSMPFDGQIPAVITGQVDVAISGFTITDERAKIVNFTEPYYDAGLGALVRTEYKDKISKLTDLEGKVICAQIGTSGAMFASQLKGATVSQFNTAAESFMELNKGSCIAAINDKPVLEYYLATSKNDLLYLLNERFTFEQYGIVTSKDNKELTDRISHGLKVIKENGTYDKIYQKWFGASN